MFRETKIETIRKIVEEADDEKLDALLLLGLGVRQPEPPPPTEPAVRKAPKVPRRATGTGLFAVVSRGLETFGTRGATEQELFDKLRENGDIGHTTELRQIVSNLTKGPRVFVKLPNDRWVCRRCLRGAPIDAKSA